jgi:hypothetical protein
MSERDDLIVEDNVLREDWLDAIARFDHRTVEHKREFPFPTFWDWFAVFTCGLTT